MVTSWTIATAQHPEPALSADRVFTAQRLVIILDGASAFRQIPVSPPEYVDTLGPALLDALSSNPRSELVDALADAIDHTARTLSLVAGDSPSSTVAVARLREDASVDLLVLGDSQIATPREILRDDRIKRVGDEHRARYRDRLRTGHGYGQGHATILAALQAEQARHRNKPDGYWIAEADPEAAQNAITQRLPPGDVTWLVLATDGAYLPMHALGLDHWSEVARSDPAGLASLLTRCHHWEASTDPNATILPRAKRHDDKTLAVAWWGPQTH